MEKIRTHRLPRRRAKREKPCFPKLRSQYGATHSFRFSLRALFNFWFFALSFVALVGCVALTLVLFNVLKVDIAKPFDALYEYDENAEITIPVETNGAANGVTVSALRRVDGGDIVVLAASGSHNHNWVTKSSEVITPSTCTTDGVTKVNQECSSCHAERVLYTVSTAEHKHVTVSDDNVTAADCTTAGYKEVVSTCDDCHTELSRIPTITPATGHTPGDPTVVDEVLPSDCTTPGHRVVETYCTECNAVTSKKTEYIPASHNYAAPVKENIIPETCTTDGSYDLVVYCTICGYKYSSEKVVVPETGHKFTYCTDTTCENGCGYTRDPAEHKYSKVIVSEKEPTCTENGYVIYVEHVCTECGFSPDDEKTEIKPAIGHSYNACDVKCKNGCGTTRPFADAHSFTYECSPTCSNCGIANPLAYHSYSGTPSCAQAVVCLVCKTEVIPALEHTRLNCRDQICSVCSQICDPINHVDTNGDYYCDVFTCMEHLRHIPVGRLLMFIFLVIFALGAVASLGWFITMIVLFIYRSFMVPTMRLEFYEDVMVWKWGVFFKRHIEKRFIGVYDVLSMPRNRYFYRDRREKKKPAKYGTVLVKVPGGGYEWNLKFYGVKHYVQLHNYLKSRQVNESIESTQIVGKIDFNN